MLDHGAGLALAEAWVSASIWGSFILGPLAALFTLWRVRRGVADADVLGVLARWLGGAALVVAASYAWTLAMVPALKVMIADCQLTEVPGDFCEDQGVAAGIPFVIGIGIAVGWLIAVPLLKAVVMVWRRGEASTPSPGAWRRP